MAYIKGSQFTVGEMRHGALVQYIERDIVCGKARCTKCPHPRYLYKVSKERVDGRYKYVERYVGKMDSERVQAILETKLGQEVDSERRRSR